MKQIGKLLSFAAGAMLLAVTVGTAKADGTTSSTSSTSSPTVITSTATRPPRSP